jgi:VanZ family protein
MKRSIVWILLWLAGILFPMALLGRLWPAFGMVFAAVFAGDWTHILMHGLLYLVLGFLLMNQAGTLTRGSCLCVLSILLAVGLVHEGIQIFAAGSWPGWTEEVKDLLVDLLGGGAGMGLALLLARSRRRRLA